MKRTLVVICALVFAVGAYGQESDVTYETSTTEGAGGSDLLSQLWLMEDATPLDAGTVDLRLGFRWVTESDHANLGDSSDNFILTPAIVWGAADNLELSLAVDNWLGDGGDMGPFEDGNYDTTVGLLWRIHEQGGDCPEHGCIRLPSIALSTSVRLPTGCGSSGVDGELRLIMTNDYGAFRSHLNVFGKWVDDRNLEDLVLDQSDFDWLLGVDAEELESRDFQWGVVIGLDGELCADGAVRWVADYMHRSSEFNGRGDMDIFEFGWEWEMSDMHKLGMSMQVGLDHVDDNPNFGAGLMYALSLGV